MRIIIEVDGQSTTVLEKPGTQPTTTTGTDTNAGTPSEALLQAVGLGPDPITLQKPDTRTTPTPPQSGPVAVDAGTPPDWLVQSLQQSPSNGMERNRYSY